MRACNLQYNIHEKEMSIIFKHWIKVVKNIGICSLQQNSAFFGDTGNLSISKYPGSDASYDSTTIMLILEVRIGETKPIFPFLSLDFLYFCHLFGLREKSINKYVFFAM